jgi:pimeloyl-ACP methyl ester carboxylesterase
MRLQYASRMRLIEFGSGNTQFLLVPGGPGLVPEFYTELTARLAETARVITYTPRGTAPRRLDDFPTTMEEAAAELEEVVASVRSDKTAGDVDVDVTGGPLVLLGHSLGSAVVIEYLVARGAGAHVDAAILMSPFSSGSMMHDGITARVRAFPAEFHRRYNNGAISPEELGGLLGEYWYPNHVCREPWPQSFLDAMTQLNPPFMDHFIGKSVLSPDGVLLDWNRDADLSAISVPTLIVSGRHDYYRQQDLEQLRDRIPHSQLVVSDRASHSIWIEDPEAFYPAVERFLAALSSSTP